MNLDKKLGFPSKWLVEKEKSLFDKDLAMFGGEEEDRTPDLRIANAALSQLSYHPEEP